PHQQAGHMTAPDQMLHQRKKALVNQAPSTHDTKRSWAGLKSRSAAVPRCAIPFVQAREVLLSETARVHIAARRSICRVAARGAGAADGRAAGRLTAKQPSR